MDTSFLVADDVHLTIRQSQILNGITLSVEEGETVGIIGPNGSGKTTFFNCLSGFLRPQKGSISLRGVDLTSMGPSERALQGLGRTFQNFGIFRDMTLEENLLTALESKQSVVKTFLPWFSQNSVNRERSEELLSLVNLQDKRKDKAGSLSGGQMRLLEIVRTLAFGAELFLLDEPTAGVSPKMKDDVSALIKKLQEMKKTIMVIEHDINFIQKFCTRIIVFDVGRVILQDAPDKVRENPLLQEIYFGNEVKK